MKTRRRKCPESAPQSGTLAGTPAHRTTLFPSLLCVPKWTAVQGGSALQRARNGLRPKGACETSAPSDEAHPCSCRRRCKPPPPPACACRAALPALPFPCLGGQRLGPTCWWATCASYNGPCMVKVPLLARSLSVGLALLRCLACEGRASASPKLEVWMLGALCGVSPGVPLVACRPPCGPHALWSRGLPWVPPRGLGSVWGLGLHWACVACLPPHRCAYV